MAEAPLRAAALAKKVYRDWLTASRLVASAASLWWGHRIPPGSCE